MKINYSIIALVHCLAMLLTACGQVVAPNLADHEAFSPAPTPLVVEIQTNPISLRPIEEYNQESTQMAHPSPPSFPSSLEFPIEKARQDLAQRLGISIDSIKVAAVIGQEFSVNAFYCQTSKERIAKDESPQVIIGHAIFLSASGHRYEYHASDDQTVIFCRPLN